VSAGMNLDDLSDTKDAAWSVTKVADLFHLDPRTVRRSCETGQIPSIKVGVRILIPTAYLREKFCPNTPDMSVDPAPTGPNTTTEPVEGAFHHDLTKKLRSA
jgi:hypothetical protein